MDSKLILPMLQSADHGLSDFREALQSLHTMLGAQIRMLAVDGVPHKLTEHGFLLLSESLMEAFGNAQSDLNSAICLIDALAKDEGVSATGVPLSHAA